MNETLSINSIKPRGWQKNAIKNLIDTSDNVLVQAATGAGKSIAVMLYLHQSKEKAVVIVHTLSLLNQWCEEMDKLGMNYYKFHGNNNTVPKDTQIVLSTWQTWHKKTRFFDPQVLILDEAHKSTSDSYDLIFRRHENARRLGFSATPVAPMSALTPLNEIYDRLLITSTTTELMSAGVIMRPRMVDATSLSEKTEKVLSKDKGEFTASTLSKASKLNGSDAFGAAKVWTRYVKPLDNRRTFVFATDIAHARVIKKDFDKINVPSAVLVSDVEEDDLAKSEVLSALTNGDVEVVISVGMLAEGANCPLAANAILCRPTRNIALSIQMQGRVLRTTEGKSECQVIDCANVFLSTCLPVDDIDWGDLFINGFDVNPWEMIDFGGFCDGGGLSTPLSAEEIAQKLADADETEVLIGHCDEHGRYLVEYEKTSEEQKDGTVKAIERPMPCKTCTLKKQLKSKSSVRKRLDRLYKEFRTSWFQYVELRDVAKDKLNQQIISNCVGHYENANQNSQVYLNATMQRLKALVELSGNTEFHMRRGSMPNSKLFWSVSTALEEIHTAQMEVSKNAKAVLKCLRELRHSGVKLNTSVFYKREEVRTTHYMKSQFEKELLSVKQLLELWDNREKELEQFNSVDKFR